jgi:hypothetical protein
MQVPVPPADDFVYFDGLKEVHADRLAVYRQLLIKTRGAPNELIRKVFSVDPKTASIEQLEESWQAAQELVDLVRDLFKMEPFDSTTGKGARDEHCWAVWHAFVDAMADDKKKAETSPTGSIPTAPPPGSSPITPPTSD